MEFLKYKAFDTPKIQTHKKNQESSGLILNSFAALTQEPAFSQKKTFRKFAHSQERNAETDAYYQSDPKEKLISQFTQDAKVVYGHNDDPRRAHQMSNYIRSQPKTIIHNKGSIEINKRVDEYYSTNVFNIQSNINQSCYKSPWNASKEEYANMLRLQVERKEKEKQFEKKEDKIYMKKQVEIEKNDLVTEREEKLKYLERIKEDFNADNNKLQTIKRIRVTTHRNQELLDHQEQFKNLAKSEARLNTAEEYKQFSDKDYFRTDLLKQIGAKTIEKRRKRSAEKTSMY